MFEKRAKTNAQMSVEALHVPKGGAWDYYNTSRIKVASIDKTKKTDLGGFDIQAAIEKNPDNLFVKVFAIKANEVNDNGDCFSEEELRKAAHTFVGVPVFVNHQNDNVENARGKVVHSWYDEPSKGVYCINMVDRAAYPRLARGIEEGYITGTSMGAQVTYSICSICHNKAHTADEFCTHIKGGKNRKISGKYDCKYHDSPCKPTDPCPLDGKKKNDEHELIHKEAKVYEWNYDIKFIEDSFVVNPACHDCLVCDILNLDNVKTKVADKIEELRKVASRLSGAVDTMKDGSLEKTAGKAELQALTQAMNLMEHVARSMMAQKQQIQLDYVSDLVEQLAKVQSLTDELTEMGYAQLPSPPEQAVALGNVMSLDSSMAGAGAAQQVSNPSQVGQGAQSLTQSPQPQTAPQGSPQSGSMAGLGSVTRPSFVGASEELKKEFLKQGENISSKLASVSSALRASIVLLAQRSKEVAESEHIAEFVNGDTRVVIANVDGSGLVFGKFKDNKLVSWASVEEFGDEIKALASSNPQEAAKIVLSQYQKESGVNMSAQKTTKIAGGEASQLEVTTQKQLDNAGPLHPREDKAPTVTTQAQLDGDGELKPVNDTTSDDNQLRKGNAPEVITQAQLDSIEHDDIARWDSYPEVITEAQWTEMSRRVSTSISKDYTEKTTQAQLESLQKSHKWTAPEVTTQAQLDEHKKVAPEGKTDSARWASSAKDLVKAASSAVADAIAHYNLTPGEVSAAVSKISSSPFSSIKAGYLALINASPVKVKARLAERNRKNYFAKVASSSGSKVRSVDALLASMGDNIGYLKAEDFVDAIKFVASDKKAFAAAETLAHTKLAAAEDSSEEAVVSKEDAFRQAFAELDRPEDGLYKICGTLTEDIKVNPDNQTAFMNALFTFAKSHIEVPFVVTNVKLDKEAGIFEAECKEEDDCSEEEKKAFASVLSGQFKTATQKPQGINKTARSANRANLLKEAQMMGGQMGGGMGGGGPAGGMGATMPGADAGMGGAPAAESLSGPGDELGAGEDDMMGGEEGDMQPKPPGTICPVCGSSDVDVLDGKGKCGNCSAEFSYKVELEITKYPGLIDSGEEEPGEAGLGGDEGAEGGEGFALPEEPASLPVAAMTRLNPAMLKKAAEDAKAKGIEWSLGSISPYTGSTSVMKLSNNKFLCLDTGSTYEVHVAGVDKGGKKAVFAEWRFEAKPLARGCESCRRKKSSFMKALKSAGINEDTFDSMMLFDKGDAIMAMKDKGLLSPVKTASKNSVLSGLKKTAAFEGKFPIETCREKIARKYGENALAMSGPCEGKNLADCVCQKLSTAGVYANDVAIKLASIWKNEDLMVTCVEDFVRSRKFSMKQACFVCDQLKAKYAQFEDHLADELSGGSEVPPSPTDGAPSPEGDMGGDMGGELGGDVDPFASDMGGDMGGDVGGDVGGELGGGDPMAGTITIELPLDVIEQFDAAIDMAKGENPAAEPHHNAPLDGTATISLPGEVAEGVDQAADQALETAVDATQEVGSAVGGALDAVQDAVQEAPGVVDSNPVELKEDVSVEVAPEGGDMGGAPETGESEVSVEEPSSNPFGGESSEGESSEGEGESSEPSEENSEEKEDSSSDFSNDSEEGSEDKEEFKLMAQAESATNAFRKGKISSSGEINLDLSSVMKVLASQGKIAKEVTHKNVQDHTEDFGKVKDGGTMGNEEKFDAKDPEVFSGDATMGGEKDAGYDNSKPKANFEAGGGEMGHEKELGYTSEKEHEMTGGTQGAGKSASSKARTSALAERILNATKTASDKKLEKAAPVSEDGDTKPYAANKDRPNSGNPITPQESADIGKVEAGDSSFMGHEKETLVSVPKAEKDAPSIPAGGGTNPKYDKNEKNAPEKQTAQKGTVIAGSDAESSAAKKEAATRVAGRKLKAGMISIDKLASEIEKLARYEPSDLKDLETALFGASKKGLDTVAKGSEKPLVISERSNQRKIGEELKDSIQSLFKLDKANKLAQEDPNMDLRQTFRR